MEYNEKEKWDDDKVQNPQDASWQTDEEKGANDIPHQQQDQKEANKNMGSFQKPAKGRSIWHVADDNDEVIAASSQDEVDLQEMVERLLIEGLGHHILPKLIHTSSWDEVRQILRVSTACREDIIESIEVKDGDGDNLLNVALFKRAPPDILLNLITIGGKDVIEETNNSGQTSLHYACRYDANDNIVRELLNVGGAELLRCKDEDQMTALHSACSHYAHESVVKLILERGGTDLINEIDGNGFTALHFCCRSAGDSAVAKMLLDHGPSNLVCRATYQGWTALHHACANEASPDLVQLLVSAGRNDLIFKKNEDGYTALYYACLTHDTPSTLVILLDALGDDFIRSDEAANGLFLACAKGASACMVMPFLERGCKIRYSGLIEVGGRHLLFAEDDHRNKVIHYCCEYCVDFDIIKTILDAAGAARDELILSRNDNGNTPLHSINASTPLDVIDLLVQNNNHLLLFLKDNDGDCPLDCLVNENSNFPEEQILYLQELMYEHDKTGSTIQTKTLTNIRDLPYQQRAVVLRGKYVRTALNHLAIEPTALFVIFLDIIIQVLTLWIYSYEATDDLNLYSSLQILLVVSLCWVSFREATQFFSSSFWAYMSDPSNIIDFAQIVLVGWTVASFFYNFEAKTKLYLLISSIGISWVRLVFVCSNVIYNIKVFVSALVSITKRLTPFIYVTIVIVMAFAHMFFAAGPPNGITCPTTGDVPNVQSDEYTNGGWACSLNESYFHSFAMLLSGDFAFFNAPSGLSSGLSLLFASVIGIVLLNILIAVVNDSFVKVEGNSENAFWLGRLRFIDEVGDIKKFLSPKRCRKGNQFQFEAMRKVLLSSLKENPQRRMFSHWDTRAKDAWENFPEFVKLIVWFENGDDDHKLPFAKRMYAFFNVAQWNEIIPPSEGFRKVMIGAHRREEIHNPLKKLLGWLISFVVLFLFLALFPFILILGLITGGLFWPSGLKEYLFFGPIEHKPVQVQKRDIAEIRSMEAKFAENIADLKETLAEDQSTILTLLQRIEKLSEAAC